MAAPKSSLDDARAYLAKCPPAVSGQAGHNTAFQVVTSVVHGFALDERDALDVLMKGRPPLVAHLPRNPSDTVQ